MQDRNEQSTTDNRNELRLFMSRNQLLALAFGSHWKPQEVQSNCLKISRIPQTVIEVEQIKIIGSVPEVEAPKRTGPTR